MSKWCVLFWDTVYQNKLVANLLLMIDKKPFINELAFVNSDDIMVFEVFLAQTFLNYPMFFGFLLRKISSRIAVFLRSSLRTRLMRVNITPTVFFFIIFASMSLNKI